MTVLDDSQLTEETLSSEQIYKGSIITVRKDQARTPDGKSHGREVVEHPGGAVVMPILPNGNLLMIKQFRYPLGHVLYEFPAGKLDPGESFLTTVQRELIEETGYTADVFEELASVYTSPGFCNERIGVYKATGLRELPDSKRAEDEWIQVFEVSVEDVRQMIRDKKLEDAKSICAFAMVFGMHG